MKICVAKEYPSHRLVANRLATKLAMLFPVHFTPAMETFLEQRGAVLVPDDSQPTRMVSIKELKGLHDARQDAGRLDVSDHRQTSNSSTSSSFATGRTSIFDCQTSIFGRQTREKMPGESFRDAGQDAANAPAPKRMKVAEC